MSVVAALLCACTPDLGSGPSTWPTATQLRELAKPQTAIEAAEPVVNAVFGDEPLALLLRGDARERLRPGDEKGALRRLRFELGPVQGVSEERMHREGNLRWYAGLWVCGSKRATPNLALLRFALDENDEVVALLLRRHFRRDQVTFPAESYETVNRFRLPASDTWTVTQGGPSPKANKHHADHQQRWAYDMIVERDGRARRGERQDNSDYFAHGMHYLAPAPGTVVYARDDRPETALGKGGQGGGNGVIIDHGFGEYSASWHFIPGTLRVGLGDQVMTGQVLGDVGNSGRSSQPHIHVHLASGPPGTGSDGLPMWLSDVVVAGEPKRRGQPVRGDRVSNAEGIVQPATSRRRGVYLEL